MAAKTTDRQVEVELPLTDPTVEALTDWLVRACERRSATEQRKTRKSSDETPEGPST